MTKAKDIEAQDGLGPAIEQKLPIADRFYREPETVQPVDETARMMQIAIEQGEAGVAALERLVAMRERAEDRLAARQYAEAVALFQEACPVVGKNAAGAHGARYSTLDQIMAVIRPALTTAGLSVTFDTEEVAEKLRVVAIVHHRCGHSERSSFLVSREGKSNRMNDTQRDGSALSYGRRYALCMALGISTGDATDDDGAGAGAEDEECITEEQAATLIALATEVAADMPKFKKWMGVEAIGDIKASRYDKAVRGLEAKR